MNLSDSLPMPQKSRYRILLGLGFLAVGGGWLFRDALRTQIAQRAGLANAAPAPELVEEIIRSSPDRTAAIVAAWNTAKIVQRETAVREISRAFPRSQPLPTELKSIVLAGALDPDIEVRETVLSILQERRDPALSSLAAVQFQDPDPQVRLLGLNHFRSVEAGFGMPAVMGLLDEGDPLIVATALKLLEHWSGEKFGVKLSDTVPFENPKTGLQEFPEGSHETTLAGAARARKWWSDHQADFPQVRREIPDETPYERPSLPAGDFSLRDLDGRKVRLMDLRGKVVLINFWATWCPACVSEIPALIALQKQNGEKLAIIGVSLDFVPDSHGDIGGHPAVEENSQPEDDHRSESNSIALQRVREKVARTVKTRGINYKILLDEKNEIGGRFNGGELPTTIIVDANGNIRRRFIGARSLAVFEAMIAEAGLPEKRAKTK